MTSKMPDCTACKHLKKYYQEPGGPTCDAFPGGIPKPIAFGDQQHREPFEGDRSIQFEPIEGFEFMLEE